jgi:hypothetical protein
MKDVNYAQTSKFVIFAIQDIGMMKICVDLAWMDAKFARIQSLANIVNLALL